MNRRDFLRRALGGGVGAAAAAVVAAPVLTQMQGDTQGDITLYSDDGIKELGVGESGDVLVRLPDGSLRWSHQINVTMKEDTRSRLVVT